MTYKVSIEPLEEAYGEFDRDTQTIKVSSKLPRNEREAALLHEIFHGLNAGFEAGGDASPIHMLMESLSLQLYQVLVDNDMLK